MNQLYILLINLIFIFASQLYSKDYLFDSKGSSDQKVLKFTDGSKYTHITTYGWWTDSNGNYGKETCYGYIESSNENINLNIKCELTDQNEKILKVSRKRNSIEGAGVGVNIYLETSEEYNYLLGKKCTYAVTFLKSDFFYKQKCKIF
tara:strand:- start:37 stop:480 length:444 start_codon:yes stop_codon:yes gene_type:complete